MVIVLFLNFCVKFDFYLWEKTQLYEKTDLIDCMEPIFG